MVKKPGPDQEPLFAVSRDTGDFAPPHVDVDRSSPSIGIIERAIHLHNTLSLFDETNQRRGLVDGLQHTRPEVVRRRYGKDADQVIAGAEANAKRLFTEAKWEFSRAFGMAAVEQSGQIEPDQLKAGARYEFGRLWQSFGLPSRVTERVRKQRQLEKIITGMQDAHTRTNREAGIRPHQELVEPKEAGTTREPGQLGLQSRLKAVNEDPRAGFLPVTRNELNRTLAFLDYLDNPEYPFGIRNQLFEVYCHQMRGKTVEETAFGMEAIESITFEIGQNLTDAHAQLQALRELEVMIRECPNPNVTLAEEIEEGHPGLAPLVRYLDIRELMETGRVAGLRREPMRQHRNERAANLPGQNKVIEDQYTRSEPTEYFKKYIAEKVAALKIGPMRSAIQDAITDQEKRYFFAHMRVRDIAEAREARQFATGQNAARLVLKKLAS